MVENTIAEIKKIGTAAVKRGSDKFKLATSILHEHDELKIPITYWHQLINNTNEELRIVEIQYGLNCIEEDIERI